MATPQDEQIILVTGATNGIGLDTVKYLASASTKNHVIIGARNLSKGERILKDLSSQGLAGTLKPSKPMLSAAPKIINVSSCMGSIGMISDHANAISTARYPGYRMSKAALNMLTAYQYLHLEAEGKGFKIWTYCPGYVATDIGEDRREREAMGVESSDTSAQGILEIIEGKRDADVGGLLARRGERYEW